MKEVLEFGTPFVRCYQHYAFPMGILSKKLHKKEYLYNLFLALTYDSNSLWCIEFNHPYFLSTDGIFVAGNAMYPKEYEKNMELIEFVKDCIHNETYVSGVWNEFFIPQKQAYQKQRCIRNYLIVGYNDEEQYFNSVGYIGENIWAYFPVSYNNFLNAIFMEKQSFQFNLYIYNKNFDKSIQILLIAEELKNYLKSQPWGKTDSNTYGIQANQEYFKNFIEFSRKANVAVLPPLQALYEHKIMMRERLEYLSEKHIIELPKQGFIKFQEIPKTYKHLLNRAIKYNFTRREEVLQEITKIGLEAVDLEEQLLSQVKFNIYA